jgi:hypothetical protein
MASASASMPDIGRTMTVNSVIAPSVELDEVASLDLLVADSSLEHERVVAGVVGADLAYVAEVFEHHQNGIKKPAHRFTAVIRLEDGGAAKDHVLAHESDGGVEITRFDGAAEGMHHLTTSIIN